MRTLAVVAEGDPGRERRRARLIAAHGQPVHVPSGDGLRVVGLRGEVHPVDVAAFVYRDRAAAEAWAAEDDERYGVPTLALAVVEGGVLRVLDLRPALARAAEGQGLAWRPADPALPDGWHPGRTWRQGGGR